VRAGWRVLVALALAVGLASGPGHGAAGSAERPGPVAVVVLPVQSGGAYALGPRAEPRAAAALGERLVHAAADLRGVWAAPEARRLARAGQPAWHPPAGGEHRPRGRSPPGAPRLT
jgi:hypothetical protein